MKLKKQILSAVAIAFLISGTSFAQNTKNDQAEMPFDVSDFSAVPYDEAGKPSDDKSIDKSPFSLMAHVDAVDKAKINNGFYEGDYFTFAEADAQVNAVFYYCPAYSEGAVVGIEYTGTKFEWSNNPWFDQDYFNNVSFLLSGFTKRMDDWYWKGQLSVNVDADEWESSYTSYDLTLWGRYSYCRNIGVHVGLIVETGMQLDRVYPIFGFDWQIFDNVKLNLIFPVNMALEYTITKNWGFNVAARTFNSRYRVGKNEAAAGHLVRYTNVGLEAALTFTSSRINVNLHAGRTLGGQFRISNYHNNHPHHYDLDPANYAGLELFIQF